MSSPAVLVFSADPFAAALLGAAAELSGYVAAFPRVGELPRDAILRVRPRAVLVDCDHEEACSERFFGPALMTGARVAVFSSHRSRRTLEPIAAQYGVRTFSLPIDVPRLAALLDSLARHDEP